MRTIEWPEREAFLSQLDQLKERHRIRHDSALAELAGISHTSISNWRNGKARPSTTAITRIASATEESARSLLTVAGLIEGQDDDADPLADLDPILRRLIVLYRNADHDERAEIVSTIEPSINMVASLQELRRQALGKRSS
ncbi:helix-turn-helix domain-containing protein [Actinoplanes aureus]|uniref:Helix-turn-helix domain-containing protein n=1 Tax=Actinoplanes aureus TaxID=2792083 RepID=A0A931BZY0_9ACTN|nr:helix-turn-helix domain-containing protein [Actinoplanes aureus]MBG0560694.1 helix-turn-helix domain-containing protein [Actinoplanes aureus]